MKSINEDRFDGRLKTASDAKRQRLERFKAAAADREKLAKRTERLEAAATIEAEQKDQAMKLRPAKEDVERQKAETAEREGVQAVAREAELETELADAVDREIKQTVVQEAERKAERDRRYAARRNRKR